MLLHHQQDQRGDNVQRGNHDDQADGEGDGHLFQPQRGKERTVHGRPVVGEVLIAKLGRDRLRDPRRRVDVVDAKLDQIDLALGKHPFGRRQRDKPGGRIELVEAKTEDAGQTQRT